jgi:predicted metal-dependent enzyme (double-stranded beta helix superfamily)
MNALVSTSTPKMSPALTRLIAEIRATVRRGTGPAETSKAVADVLQPYLGDPDFLTAEQMQPDECAYCRHLLHVEPDRSFSVVALVWLPGQETAVHDHVSWCVVGVHRGEEDETSYCLVGDEPNQHLVVTGHTVNPVASTVALVPPGDIHRVKNSCNDVAVSLHVYGADVETLGSSILRRYDHEIRG